MSTPSTTNSDVQTAAMFATYNINMRIRQLSERLRQFDMQDVFTRIVRPDTVDPTMPASTVMNLLTDYGNPELSLQDVKNSVKFYRTYGQTYDLQDLQWSYQLLVNSCEPGLRDKVAEQLLTIDDIEVGGPVFFYVMLKVITTSTEGAIRLMIVKIKDMRIIKQPGKNVDYSVSLIRGNLVRLRAVDKVPYDIIPMLLDVFQTSSVDSFNFLFKTMKTNQETGMYTGPALTTERILEVAEIKYKSLVEEGNWHGDGRDQ